MTASKLTNAEIADRLASFGALLDLAERSPFAVRAYRRAADLVRAAPVPIAELVRTGRVRELRGIGPGIEAKLRELVETGAIAELRALEDELSPALVAYGRSLGLSATRTLAIGRQLGLRSVDDLREAVRSGRIREVPGVGAVTEARLRAGIERDPVAVRGLTLRRSRQLTQDIAAALDGEPAGPARRYCELVHELVVVCAAADPSRVIRRFEELPAVVALVAREERRAVGLTVEGVPVVLWVATPDAAGTALFRATGAKEYVEALEPLPVASSERELFAALGLDYCPPELREEPGATAPSGLLELGAVRGELHCHTTWSDGKAGVEEMARAARARGYDYVAICDHTPNVRVVPGLDRDALLRQAEEIAAVNERLAPFRVLRGVECDIRADGALDVDDDVLSSLEWVQLSLHAGQRRPGSELTKMVTEAMRHPAVRALSHPKGRILGHRPENAVDLEEVFTVALEADVALEVNGLPDRLDLSAAHVREALAAGVDLVVGSDAHSELGLDNMELAVATARKGGAPASAVVNCRPLDALLGD